MNIKNVVVTGGGVLGSQIAFQSAFCGFNVTIWLRSEGSIERTKPKLERLKDVYLNTLEQMKTDKSAYCRGFSDKEDLTIEEIDELKECTIKAYDGIKLTTSYEDAAADADLVIEAIAEDPEQKISFYQELAKHLLEKTILVTNSSTMLPSSFAKYTGRPEKYLALHFANSIDGYLAGGEAAGQVRQEKDPGNPLQIPGSRLDGRVRGKGRQALRHRGHDRTRWPGRS